MPPIDSPLFRHCDPGLVPGEAIHRVAYHRRPGLLRRLRLLAMTGRERQPAVYIMANKRIGTLYTGVTSNLPQRAWQHRSGAVEGFTKRYGCKMLVWYETAPTMETAILREKQLKGGSRAKKLALIEEFNPRWDDLYEAIAHG